MRFGSSSEARRHRGKGPGYGQKPSCSGRYAAELPSRDKFSASCGRSPRVVFQDVLVLRAGALTTDSQWQRWKQVQRLDGRRFAPPWERA